MDETTITNAVTFLNEEKVKDKFKELLGKRGNQFLASAISIVSQNENLKNADPLSVYLCTVNAAILDLPLGQLGFAYIIPYRGQDGKQVAQFQIGYKGLIQLALRSNQFKTIAASPIYDGQIKKNDPLRGMEFDRDNKKSNVIIGYAAYFSLVNGFEKTLYMTKEEIETHGKKFSKMFLKGYGLWKDEFDAMALKTVLKLLIGKFAPLNLEMQQALITDQGVIKNEDMTEIEYVDNTQELDAISNIDEELLNRYRGNIQQCKTKKELNEFVKQNKPTHKAILSIIHQYAETLQS